MVDSVVVTWLCGHVTRLWSCDQSCDASLAICHHVRHCRTVADRGHVTTLYGVVAICNDNRVSLFLVLIFLVRWIRWDTLGIRHLGIFGQSLVLFCMYWFIWLLSRAFSCSMNNSHLLSCLSLFWDACSLNNVDDAVALGSFIPIIGTLLYAFVRLCTLS